MRQCPSCGSQEKVDLPEYSKADWVISRCLGCSMVYLVNPPLQSALFDEYAWEDTSSQERIRRRENRKFYYFFSDGLKKLKNFLRSFFKYTKEIHYVLKYAHGFNILDIGAADGKILDVLPVPYIPYGIEPSPTLQQICHEKYEQKGGFCIKDVAISGLENVSISFDFVLMRSFLEHDSEMFSTLESVFGRLSETGGVLIKVPNFDCWNAKLRKSGWPGMRYPDHVNYFTPLTLKNTLQRVGFEEVYMPFHWRLPTSDNVWALAYKTKHRKP